MENTVVYAWMKDAMTNENSCVINDVYCTTNVRNEPILTCSLNRNKDKPICTDTAAANTSYRVLGCYSSSDCDGHVSEDTTTTIFPSCSIDQKKECSDPTDPTISDRCMMLYSGIMPDVKNGQQYCFLGGLHNYDPCQLSAHNGGPDFCPKSCFNPKCCPGSF